MIDFDIEKYDRVLSRGLCRGLGNPSGPMCIEAAICYTLGLQHGDDPKCVAVTVRSFKITLNDAYWSTPQARAKGLRNLGLAQLGSLGVVDDEVFTQLLLLRVIQKLVPEYLRENPLKDIVPEQFEQVQTLLDAEKYFRLTPFRNCLVMLYRLCEHARYSRAKAYIYDIVYITDFIPNNRDKYLIMLADICLDVLKELQSPGCSLLSKGV